MSTGQKEYVIRFNGVDKAVKDFTTLEQAITAMDNAAKKVNDTEIKVAATSKQKKAALTDEEKAAKKLADTQKKIAEANSDANKAQIKANQELRERTREVSRQVAAEQLAADSVKAMGMQLTDLRNKYEELTAAERAEQEVGGKLLEQIQALDAEYKAIRESTGNFRDSVGNYEKATAGLNELKDRFELASRGAVNMATDVVGTNDVLDAFAGTTDTVAKSAEQLAGITALATTAQEVYNAIVKEGWIEQKAAAVMDGVRAVQTKAAAAAQALATKNTIAATVVQRIFNVVANANPYVLLATALITVVGALVLFASRTDDAAEKQDKLNASQNQFYDYLERESAKLKEVGDARERMLENQLALLQASGAKTKDIQAIEDKLARERLINAKTLLGVHKTELGSLDSHKEKVEKLYVVLNSLQNLQRDGVTKFKLDIDLDGKIDKGKVDEAIQSVQGQIDALNRPIKFRTELEIDVENKDAAYKQLLASQAKANADAAKANADAAKERADKAREDAKQRAEIELNETRAAEDARISLVENSYERQRQTINAQYDREIQDLKKKLATEKNLTTAARQAINDSIVAADEKRNRDLVELSKEITEKEIQEMRAAADLRLQTIVGTEERAAAEIRARYNRQIEDLKLRLNNEKSLTEKQQHEINQQIILAGELREKELNELSAKGLQQRAAQELTALEFTLEQSRNKIDEMVVRDKDGLQLIDVDATRQNFADINAALNKYVVDLTNYDDSLKASHEATLANLKEGTPEYIDEVQKYAAAHEGVTQRIKKAQKEQAENTKESSKTISKYYVELFEGIANYAQAGADVIAGFTEALNTGLQIQVEALNTQIDALAEKYEDAQKMREDAAKNVEDIEARLQAATGGTAEALKSQLADATHARNEAAREEQRMAIEKEKKEAELRKKEKQIKRNELITGIAMGIANTAQGVTKALASFFPPLNFVMAALTGAAGILQTGIMVKQLAKLEKGGELKGPSHANGGIKITGSNVEVEGGEFVTNKRTYSKNKGLIQYINAQDKTLTAQDLSNFFSRPLAIENMTGTYLANGGEVPVIVNDAAAIIDYDELAEAMGNVNLRPVVAVTDILDVQDEMTTVQDLAGF